MKRVIYRLHFLWFISICHISNVDLIGGTNNMGQRLVLTIKKDEENVAAIYYHWSGYTRSSFYEIKQLLDDYDSEAIQRIDDVRLKILRCIELHGGGLDADERNNFESMYPGVEYQKEINSNYGLVSLTQKGIEHTEFYGEEFAVLDLDDKRIINRVFSQQEPEEVIEYLSDVGYDKEKLSLLPVFPYNPEDIPISKLDDIQYRLNEMTQNGDCYFWYNDELYGLIE